jgi:hypothetical protein
MINFENSCYFKKFYFLQETSLNPKFYKRIFLWDAKSTPNYSKTLISAGLDTFTLIDTTRMMFGTIKLTIFYQVLDVLAPHCPLHLNGLL